MRTCIKVTVPGSKAYGYARDFFTLDRTLRDLTDSTLLPSVGTKIELELVELDEKKYANVFPLVPQVHPVNRSPRPAPSDGKMTTLACSCSDDLESYREGKTCEDCGERIIRCCAECMEPADDCGCVTCDACGELEDDCLCLDDDDDDDDWDDDEEQ